MSQWQVNNDNSVNTLDAPIDYEIPAARLLERSTRLGKEYYDWPLHMAEKNGST